MVALQLAVSLLLLLAADANVIEFASCKFESGGVTSSYDCVPAKFGPESPTKYEIPTTSLINAADTNGCAPTPGAEGKFLLTERGVCTFATKALNAMESGAIGVFVANNIPGGTNTCQAAPCPHEADAETVAAVAAVAVLATTPLSSH